MADYVYEVAMEDITWDAMVLMEQQLMRCGETAAYRRLRGRNFSQAITDYPERSAEELISLLLCGLRVPR